MIPLAEIERHIPPDFMFHLSTEEASVLRSQSATSKPRRGGWRYPPYAFTEHGAIMAAMVLNSPSAVEMSVQVPRRLIFCPDSGGVYRMEVTVCDLQG